MPQTKWLILALGLVFAPIQAVAQTIALDAKLFDAVLRTARDYAADRNLIFYCLRKDDQMSPFLYAAVHLDIAYALQLLRAAGADDRQRAQMIEAILRNIRSASREEEDPQRNISCTNLDVERNTMQLKGVGAPLFMRSPFDQLKP